MTHHDPDNATREITIDATPSDVWAALVDPASLSAWFGAEAELEPREGAAVRFRFPDGTERRGLVEDVVPGQRLTWRWRQLIGAGPSLVVGRSSTVTIDVRAEDDRTIVRVSEVAEARANRSHARVGAAR